MRSAGPLAGGELDRCGSGAGDAMAGAPAAPWSPVEGEAYGGAGPGSVSPGAGLAAPAPSGVGAEPAGPVEVVVPGGDVTVVVTWRPPGPGAAGAAGRPGGRVTGDFGASAPFVPEAVVVLVRLLGLGFPDRRSSVHCQ